MSTDLETPTPAQAPAEERTSASPSKPSKPRRQGGAGRRKLIKRAVAASVAAAILGGIVFGMWFLVFRETDEQGDIYFENAYIGSIQSTAEGSGNAAAKETVTVTIPAGGTVQELLVSAGDMVVAGQTLFSIYSPAAQNALTQAQEGVDRANGQVEALNEKAANLTLRAPFAGKLLDVTEFSRGDMVGEGATVATLVNDKKLKLSLYFSYAYEDQIRVGQRAYVAIPAVLYTTTEAVVEKINRVNFISPEGGNYFEVILTFQNPGTLTAEMAASTYLVTEDPDTGAVIPIFPYQDGKTAYYETKALVTKAGGPMVKSSLLNYADVRKGQALLTMSSDTLDEQMSAAQEAVTTAQEALDKAQADVDALNATAPIDGTIVSCTLAEGGEVKAGDTVLTISNTNTMVVTITLDDWNIGFVKLGDTISLNDYNGNSYMGVVTDIAAQGEVGQGMSTFPVTLEVDNPGGTLYAGMWLDYSFVTSQSEDCVLVPTTAVKSVLDTEGNARTVVFVYREEQPEDVVELDPNITGVPTAEDGYYPVPVETGINDPKAVEIKSGINDGDQVFINYTVTEGGGSYG